MYIGSIDIETIKRLQPVKNRKTVKCLICDREFICNRTQLKKSVNHENSYSL